ncbi:uncharacterized protein LOC132200961 isoform X2 [Neocloeon triangulifer]|uniref:uncharacterized protein LOC132200961 isoform X2 n=1 Tax=Neocloeon triangulifer TaxID=2078957 RepID=UPI00286FACD8|nr:uncharacterized protein LOC132200961 isoform X2 [Neocloeon triangulifer]
MILLLILLLSFCSAQSYAQSCPLKDAPVFSSDENLSFEDCGRRVDLPYDHYPWKAEIYSERYYCPGILISKKVVITFDEESDGFVEPTEQIRIYLGRCAEVDKEQPCTENNEGFRTTVERKVKLDIQSFDYFMYFFIIPKIPEFSDWVRPICLFNRDNSLDFSESQVYRAYSGYSVHNYTARIVQYSECFKENVENEFCDTENTMLCVFKEQMDLTGREVW